MSYKADQKTIEKFDPEDYIAITQLFKEHDKNGDGMIQKKEFMIMAKEFNPDIKLEKVKSFFNSIDSNNDSVSSFNEYLHFILECLQEDKKK